MPSAACGVPQTERGGFWGLCLHGGFFGFLHDFIQVPRCDCCSGLPEGFVWLVRTLDEFL